MPPTPPVMVHHIPRYLDHFLKDDSHAHAKIALLLADGLSLDQWVVIRQALSAQWPNLRLREESVFAWAPTLTPVSRQATFSGRVPNYFPSSIHGTDREEGMWMQFWMDQDLTQVEVRYAKGLGDGSMQGVEEILSHPKVRVVGLVIDKVDKIMHGMQLGTRGMHNQVRQWAEEGWLKNLLELLLGYEFNVFLTSDHGNIEAEGAGRPSEGVVADRRGQRARVYTDDVLRKQTKAKFADAIEWPSIGLPSDYLPLLAPGRKAFIQAGKRIVGHGGVCLEELVVPFIHIGGKPG